MSNIKPLTLREELAEIRRKLTLLNITLYTIGMLCIGVGVAFMIRSSVGMSSWDSLHTAMSVNDSFFTFGMASFTSASIAMMLTIYFYKKWSFLVMILPIFLVAIFIDVFNVYVFQDITAETLFDNIFFFTIGLFILPFGATLMIITKLPAGVYDQFMLAILYKLKSTNIVLIRAIMEVTVVLIALIIGLFRGIGFGSINIGTLIFSLSIGALITLYLRLFERIGLYETKQND